jgi:hypothetical protein
MRFMNVKGAALFFLLALSCGRYRTPFTGAEFTSDGTILRIAAEAGRCGCITLTNRYSQRLRVRSTAVEVLTGDVYLAPGEQIVAKFDWAGPSAEQEYHITTFAMNRARIDAEDALRVDYVSAWRSCIDNACDWGPLNMHMAHHVR